MVAKKADDNLGEDNILDLDNVVWRGINQSDRLNRLAEAARQADGELPEPGEKIYPPKNLYYPLFHFLFPILRKVKMTVMCVSTM